jgi:hypothetical protein
MEVAQRRAHGIGDVSDAESEEVIGENVIEEVAEKDAV